MSDIMKKIEETLEFYAERGNYSDTPMHDGLRYGYNPNQDEVRYHPAKAVADGGKQARAALAAIKDGPTHPEYINEGRRLWNIVFVAKDKLPPIINQAMSEGEDYSAYQTAISDFHDWCRENAYNLLFTPPKGVDVGELERLKAITNIAELMVNDYQANNSDGYHAWLNVLIACFTMHETVKKAKG